MYHSFLIHSSADGHLGCFHVLAIYKQCCNEHWGTCVSFNSGFLGVYAQQWDCWVMLCQIAGEMHTKWSFSLPHVYMHAKSLPSCLTLCDPKDHSPPGSSVHGILQKRILEWVAIPFFRGSFQSRDWIRVSYVYLHRQTSSLPLVPTGKPKEIQFHMYRKSMRHQW